jgi:hypothetical protein
MLCDEGSINYDEAKGIYFMKVRGMTFPFKTDPCEAANIEVYANNDPATELVEALLSRSVNTVTLLTDAKDGDESIRAADEVYSYLSIGRGSNIVWATTEKTDLNEKIASLNDASPTNSIVYLKGPNAGATETKVRVDGNKVIIEGGSYEGLVMAADRVVLEMAAIFCGSATCKDPVGCAAGRSCGCQNR